MPIKRIAAPVSSLQSIYRWQIRVAKAIPRRRGVGNQGVSGFSMGWFTFTSLFGCWVAK